MSEIKDVGITLRMSSDMHKKLRFVAADRDMSLNELINRMIDSELAISRVQIPTGLQYQPGSEQ